MQSKDNYKSTVNVNKQYRHIVQNARMYISHFIQVLNLAVIRGEIKKEQKLLYGLDPHQHVVPDLTTGKPARMGKEDHRGRAETYGERRVPDL